MVLRAQGLVRRGVVRVQKAAERLGQCHWEMSTGSCHQGSPVTLGREGQMPPPVALERMEEKTWDIN